MTGLANTYGIPVVEDPTIPPGRYKIDGDGRRIRVHNFVEFKKAIDDFNRDFAIIETKPLCLLDRRTGQLVDLATGELAKRRWPYLPAWMPPSRWWGDI